MERTVFIMKIRPGRRAAVDALLAARAEAFRGLAREGGVDNFSMWGVADRLFGYGECRGSADDMSAVSEAIAAALADCADMRCAPGTMRLMYHDIGIVRTDKSLIRHRVFATLLKPGCEAEYKRRHDGLIAARSDTVSEGPDSNFTIWYGDGCIFGYCEKVRAFDHPVTEEERESAIAWETRQLEIMDWLTDDVDWITGQRHEAMRRLA